MSSRIDNHPKRDEIVTAILAGQPLRQVAKLAGMSHTAVQNYVKRIVRPAVLSSAKARSMLQTNPSAEGTIRTICETKQIAKDAANSAALAPIMNRLAERQADQLELLKEAKKAKDFRGFASIDNCEHKDIELTCRLLGLLDSQTANTTNIQNNTVVLMPSIPGLDGDESDVIDVEVEP